MKRLAYILSVYVLVLTAIPCIDIPKDNSVQHIELTNTSDNQHQNETDHCSPFCSCYCCASPVIYQALNIQLGCFSMSQTQYSDYKSDFITTPSNSIWQPPQLI